MHIGERIKRARLKRGWTQRDLARHAQVNHAWIAKLESGDRHNISLEAGARVAVALGITLDYLAGITTRNVANKSVEEEDDDEERLEEPCGICNSHLCRCVAYGLR